MNGCKGASNEHAPLLLPWKRRKPPQCLQRQRPRRQSRLVTHLQLSHVLLSFTRKGAITGHHLDSLCLSHAQRVDPPQSEMLGAPSPVCSPGSESNRKSWQSDSRNRLVERPAPCRRGHQNHEINHGHYPKNVSSLCGPFKNHYQAKLNLLKAIGEKTQLCNGKRMGPTT